MTKGRMVDFIPIMVFFMLGNEGQEYRFFMNNETHESRGERKGEGAKGGKVVES